MPSVAAQRCPYCFADLDAEVEDLVGCASCSTLHHRACFLEHGRCTLLGCTSAETTDDTSAAPQELASLHPFLPREEGLVQRRASFLSVRAIERDRRKRRSAKRSMELKLPASVGRGQTLDAVLSVFTPKRIQGTGLRLVVRSILEAGGKQLVLGVTEAVVAGRASAGWLKRFKLWSREPSEQLLLPGLSAFELSFDPSPLAWNGALPTGGTGRGPRQILEVHAELDAAGGMRTPVQRIRLLDGRRPPPVLEEDARLDLDVPQHVPPLGIETSEAFSTRPLTHGIRRGGGVVAIGQFAARHAEYSATPPHVDALDLLLEPLEPGSSLLKGAVHLGLHRASLSGRLTLSITVERLGFRRGKREWRAYAREAGILCERSVEGQDVSGEHTIRFESVIPPSFHGGKPSDARRLRVRAILVGEGTPLRSPERELKLSGKRPPGRRTRRGPGL